MNRNFKGFAPRLSLAWDPTGQGKWAIRTGIGQFYNRDRLWPLQLAGNNPPFNASFVERGLAEMGVFSTIPTRFPPAADSRWMLQHRSRHSESRPGVFQQRTQ